MTCLDLQLNFNARELACHNLTELCHLFALRAATVRAGVRTSPRGLRTSLVAAYDGPKFIYLPDGYELVVDDIDAGCGLPQNLFVRDYLDIPVYGPAFLIRRVGLTFIPVDKNVLSDSEGKLLRSEAANALETFAVLQTVKG